MPQIQVRPYEERDSDAFFRVRALTYNDGVEVPPERRSFKFSRGYVAEVEGEITGTFNVLDMTCTRGPALLKCAGLAGVAVSPEMRRSGVGTAMLRYFPRQMREEGYHLSSLYPFRESWYRKFGYEVCGKRMQVTVPTHRLPKVESGLSIKRRVPADYRLIEPCYQAWAHARSGMNVRSELMWERFLNESKPNAIYTAGEPVEGYVAISHNWAFWENQQLTEVAWSTKQGFDACMEILHMLGINKSSVSWYEPSDGLLYNRYLDQGVKAEVVRPIMFRLHDVAASLRLLNAEESGEFCFETRDEILPENDGPWRVRFAPSGVEVTPGGTPDFRLDIRQLTQAFLGEPSLVDLVRLGLVEVLNGNGLREAQRLLTPSPTYCGDFF